MIPNKIHSGLLENVKGLDKIRTQIWGATTSKSPMHEVEGEEQAKLEQFQAWSEGTVTNWIIHLLKIPRNTKHLWAGEQKTVTA
jgi:hypothetical protein